MDLKVARIDRNVNDIPAGLRRLADEIEAGRDITSGATDLRNIERLVWVTEDEDGDTAMGAFGRDMDVVRSVGVCQKAAINLLFVPQDEP